MKMTLEYDETERYEHEVACKALDILILVDDIDQELRSALKHECGAFGFGKNEPSETSQS